MGHTRDKNLTLVEAMPEAEMEWTEGINQPAKDMLYTLVDSWMRGINSNVEGKNVRCVLQYLKRLARISCGV